MNGIEKVTVLLETGGKDVGVGELVQAGKKIYFKYFKDFITLKLNISPFKLPLSENIVSADPQPFDGLFGVFHDSLPDGWGLLLLDRKLASQGYHISQITPLDRLSMVGENGMGALKYQPFKKDAGHLNTEIDLDLIADETQSILNGYSTGYLETLIQLSGSSGGASPKVCAGYHPETGHLIPDANPLPDGYQHWIVKFPASADPPDIANIEYAYYQMALDAGIEMNPCQLFQSSQGRSFFGTKRFDRDGNQRIHMHSAAGLMHDNFRFSTMDYGHLMDCAIKLENDIRASEKILKLAAFNVFANNCDDHSKNFSFLMDNKGRWTLAPAYDLTFSSPAHGHHCTLVAGESKNPGKNHLMELAEHFSIKKANDLIEPVIETIRHWPQYASQCGVSNQSTRLIEDVLRRKRMATAD